MFKLHVTEDQKEECQKIMNAIVDMWWIKILEKMSVAPYPDFDAALEEVKQEMLNV